MFAGCEGGDGHFGMEGIGGGDGDHLHRGVDDQGAPVTGGFFEAELIGALGREIGRDLGEWTRRGCGPSPNTGRTAFQARAWHLPI